MLKVPAHRPVECVLFDASGEPYTDSAGHPKLHTRVPIEGAGVVHVITDRDAAVNDVVLWRHSGGAATECVHLTDCLSEPDQVHDMHAYYSDLETLCLLVSGLLYVVYVIDDDYVVRKHNELFGTPMLRRE